MKYLVSLFTLAFLFSIVELKAQSEKDGPMLKFKNENHNFGKMHIDNLPAGKVDVEFTNEGNQPLVLSNVRACCGTRVIDWPKEPIMPGQSGTAKVEFTVPPRVHVINRTVTIMSNSKNSPDIFRINGEVTDQVESIIDKK